MGNTSRKMKYLHNQSEVIRIIWKETQVNMTLYRVEPVSLKKQIFLYNLKARRDVETINQKVQAYILMMQQVVTFALK